MDCQWVFIIMIIVVGILCIVSNIILKRRNFTAAIAAWVVWVVAGCTAIQILGGSKAIGTMEIII